MKNFGLAPNSFIIFNNVRKKSGQTFPQLTSEFEGKRNKLRGNIVDLIKQDLIWCEQEKKWVLGKYYLTSKAEHMLNDMSISYDEATFD